MQSQVFILTSSPKRGAHQSARAILAHRRGDLDVLVYVTSTFKEPKLHNVRRDVEIFEELLDFPILLAGLT